MAQDLLGIVPGGQIALSGDAVLFGGTEIGRVSASEDGQAGRPLSVALNGNATRAAVEALAEALGYGRRAPARSAPPPAVPAGRSPKTG